jgi:hypothetical protein
MRNTQHNASGDKAPTYTQHRESLFILIYNASVSKVSTLNSSKANR